MVFTNIDTLVGIDIIIDYMFIAPYGGNKMEQKRVGNCWGFLLFYYVLKAPSLGLCDCAH